MSTALPSLARVRSALRVYAWEEVFRRRTYVVVFHAPGGLAWGRRGMRARMLDESPQPDSGFAPPEVAVDVRFCPAWCARKAIENVGGPVTALMPVFGSFDSLVVSGDSSGEVIKVAGKLGKSMGGSRATVVGAKVGDQVVSSGQWKREMVDAPSQEILWADLLGLVSSHSAGPVRALDRSQGGLTDVLDRGNEQLHSLLDRHNRSQQTKP